MLGKLDHPKPDAAAIVGKLGDLGFEVIEELDQTKQQLLAELGAFAKHDQGSKPIATSNAAYSRPANDLHGALSVRRPMVGSSRRSGSGFSIAMVLRCNRQAARRRGDGTGGKHKLENKVENRQIVPDPGEDR